MDALQEATAVLRNAEQKLRTILVHAVEVGDYDHLSRIAEWAKLLGATLGSGQPLPAPAAVQLESDRSLPPNKGAHEWATAAAVSAPAAVTRHARAGRHKKARRGKATKEVYPQFVREGDSLVKIGWSKSEGKTYEHKAPKSVLRALLQALGRVGAGGERFTVEALLPLKDSGSDIPDYQTYLVLAWLRSIGLVIQHGRQGYSLPVDTSLERETERHWGELATR